MHASALGADDFQQLPLWVSGLVFDVLQVAARTVVPCNGNVLLCCPQLVGLPPFVPIPGGNMRSAAVQEGAAHLGCLLWILMASRSVLGFLAAPPPITPVQPAPLAARPGPSRVTTRRRSASNSHVHA